MCIAFVNCGGKFNRIYIANNKGGKNSFSTADNGEGGPGQYSHIVIPGTHNSCFRVWKNSYTGKGLKHK